MKRHLFTLAALVFALGPLRAQEVPPALKFLMDALAESDDPATQANLLRGINKALEGRRGVPAPPQWEAIAAKLGKSENADVREQVQTLGVTFGSAGAMTEMRTVLADPNADRGAREKALDSLLAAKDQATLPLLLDLAKSPGPLRRAALRGLASFDDPRVAPFVVEAYASLDSEEKHEALATLLSRLSSAKALVASLDTKAIPTADLAAPQIRQLQGFKDAQIVDWLRAHPALTLATSNKQGEIARLKTVLTPEAIRAADPHRGRVLFAQSCALCHRLFDAGADIGPEITGANRTDVDYLLQNILDPNALIGKDYQSTTIEATDGRVLVGMIRAEDANAVTLKTLAGAVVIPRSDIRNVTVSEVSMMPEGLISALKPEQINDLFAYLASPRQVPMLITSVNATDFFSGRDLARWKVSGEAWTVADGVIVGRGGAAKPEAIISDMIAGDFKLSLQFRVTGAKGAAEIVLSGQTGEEGFRGTSVSVGGNSASNIWSYEGAKPNSLAQGPAIEPGKWVACEIESTGGKISVRFDGKPAFEIAAPKTAPRTVPGFYVFGEGTELAIKGLKIEVAP